MLVRSCRVTITDMDGVAHTVEVTASSLYEAVAQALTALRGKEWVVGIPDGFAPVKVRVLDIPVDHRSEDERLYELARPAGKQSEGSDGSQEDSRNPRSIGFELGLRSIRNYVQFAASGLGAIASS
jgi:hypothetical protein